VSGKACRAKAGFLLLRYYCIPGQAGLFSQSELEKCCSVSKLRNIIVKFYWQIFYVSTYIDKAISFFYYVFCFFFL
jgi:hypothetical protein